MRNLKGSKTAKRKELRHEKFRHDRDGKHESKVDQRYETGGYHTPGSNKK